MQHVDTFVSELGQLIPALRGVSNRSKAMLTCYPGGGARYVKHTDNHCRLGKGDNCNGRRLTSLIYLNTNWQKQHGGELRVYGGALGQQQLRDIMKGIHDSCLEYGQKPDGTVDYVKGANIAGFVKVADAMIAFGVV